MNSRAQAEHDLHDALARAADVKAQLGVPDILESLAILAGEADVTGGSSPSWVPPIVFGDGWAKCASKRTKPARCWS